MKMKLMYAIVLALVTFAFVGCSKDKDEPIQTGGSIDAAVGTYKGSLDIVGVGEKFNKTIKVTKVGDGRIKVEVEDSSLKLPSREFNVTNNMDYSIQSAATEPGAMFLFEVKNKTVTYLAKPLAEGETTFKFDGTKQ
ncbi:hypothetical protein BWD42_17115 [Sphingobacterium sp. CZ-UAM]|uniref:hypothetical protein n=1 Tax=Sphingobacterium sp. CZ-UAM TaxID=1933868 RepID=UPI0009861B6C|nr:hypothetical protein [Sphingobacterium sp. CZ-UAM]OOG17174.1 hypothetical protein BWD42_17115 [Sphingobacterium sp. CZ-UAM]